MVDLLAGLVDGVTSRDGQTSTLRTGGTSSLATAGEVDVAILDFLNDLTGVLLRLLRGVGVGDVGLKICVYQMTCAGRKTC